MDLLYVAVVRIVSVLCHSWAAGPGQLEVYFKGFPATNSSCSNLKTVSLVCSIELSYEVTKDKQVLAMLDSSFFLLRKIFRSI